MSIERYRVLIDRLCQSLGIPSPGSVYQAAHIAAGGVEFTLCYGGVLAPDSLLLYGDFGAIPADRCELVPLRLLEINSSLFDECNAAFTYDAVRHRVVLACRLALDEVILRSALDCFFVLAQGWREGCFMAAGTESGDRHHND